MTITETPFFSVVIPVHNKAPFVGRAIASVLNQTFADFELLLIDDASTDDSRTEINRFSDPKIRILHRDMPGPGGYAARNLGIAHACGTWVAFLDADDEWYSDHLAVLHKIAINTACNVAATSWLDSVGPSELRYPAFLAYHEGTEVLRLDFNTFLRETGRRRIPIWTSAAAVRLGLIRSIGGFPINCRRGGDTVTWLRLVRAAGTLCCAMKPTAVYHTEASSVTRNMPPEVQHSCVYIACDDILRQTRDSTQRVLLKRFSNFYVKSGLAYRARTGTLSSADCVWHYFSANRASHMFFLLYSLLPPFLQQRIWAVLSRCRVMLAGRS